MSSPQTVADLAPDDRVTLECMVCRSTRIIKHWELPAETTIERMLLRAPCNKCGANNEREPGSIQVAISKAAG